MIWALLAMLGVPIWLVVGLLIGILLRRRNFKKQPDVFPCVVRDEGAAKWPRAHSICRQIRDVFVVNDGAAYFRTEINAVDRVDQLEIGEDGPKKLVDPAGRVLTLANGSRIEVAVSSADVARLDALAG